MNPNHILLYKMIY